MEDLHPTATDVAATGHHRHNAVAAATAVAVAHAVEAADVPVGMPLGLPDEVEHLAIHRHHHHGVGTLHHSPHVSGEDLHHHHQDEPYSLPAPSATTPTALGMTFMEDVDQHQHHPLHQQQLPHHQQGHITEPYLVEMVVDGENTARTIAWSGYRHEPMQMNDQGMVPYGNQSTYMGPEATGWASAIPFTSISATTAATIERIVRDQFDIELLLKRAELQHIEDNIQQAEELLLQLENFLLNKSVPTTTTTIAQRLRNRNPIPSLMPQRNVTIDSNGQLFDMLENGTYIRWYCPICQRNQWASTQGLRNHIRFAHHMAFVTREEFMRQCTQVVDESEVPYDHPCRTNPIELFSMGISPSLANELASIKQDATASVERWKSFQPDEEDESVEHVVSSNSEVQQLLLQQSEVDTDALPEEGSRFYIRKRFIVGNSSQFIRSDKERRGENEPTHNWMVYVKGPPEEEDVAHFVSKVRFFLHPSFRPNDTIDVTEPPFFIKRRGWGEFPIRVQLHFRDSKHNKPVDIIHMLRLDNSLNSLSMNGVERAYDVEIDRLTYVPPSKDSAISSSSSSKNNQLTPAPTSATPLPKAKVSSLSTPSSISGFGSAPLYRPNTMAATPLPFSKPSSKATTPTPSQPPSPLRTTSSSPAPISHRRVPSSQMHPSSQPLGHDPMDIDIQSPNDGDYQPPLSPTVSAKPSGSTGSSTPNKSTTPTKVTPPALPVPPPPSPDNPLDEWLHYAVILFPVIVEENQPRPGNLKYTPVSSWSEYLQLPPPKKKALEWSRARRVCAYVSSKKTLETELTSKFVVEWCRENGYTPVAMRPRTNSVSDNDSSKLSKDKKVGPAAVNGSTNSSGSPNQLTKPTSNVAVVKSQEEDEALESLVSFCKYCGATHPVKFCGRRPKKRKLYTATPYTDNLAVRHILQNFPMNPQETLIPSIPMRLPEPSVPTRLPQAQSLSEANKAIYHVSSMIGLIEGLRIPTPDPVKDPLEHRAVELVLFKTFVCFARSLFEKTVDAVRREQNRVYTREDGTAPMAATVSSATLVPNQPSRAIVPLHIFKAVTTVDVFDFLTSKYLMAPPPNQQLTPSNLYIPQQQLLQQLQLQQQQQPQQLANGDDANVGTSISNSTLKEGESTATPTTTAVPMSTPTATTTAATSATVTATPAATTSTVVASFSLSSSSSCSVAAAPAPDPAPTVIVIPPASQDSL